ncbi:MAG TPA: T9SS type A sorting domain-containing protein [Bacteroidales bacterium]|nr:T9SS type A sorting domain-containing protein [Bacteroidales bacterium]HQM70867.1 T9SS type A sorting domain-containing protein [Bacteroidales bacterium]
MRNTLILILLSFSTVTLFSQVPLIIEGQVIVDTETGVSNGYNIPRNQVTALTFRNNKMTSVNSSGYILQAGDEKPGLNSNHLDGAVITGNMLIWNGTDKDSWTHALFTGYNLGVIIKYNYLLNTPNGIQRKSDGMTDETGVVAYNIIKNPKVGIVVKGMNGVRIYNNTLYTDKTTEQTGRGLIDVHTNIDAGLNAPSAGTQIFNNIFYTKHNTLCINVMDKESLEGFRSDYNIFYSESGSPGFNAGGVVVTFAEWQALGYDLNSVVINPRFNDFTDFVPTERLDYGTDLGDNFAEGLAINAEWGAVSPKTAMQNGKWQAGARIYEAEVNDTTVLPPGETKIYPNPAFGFFYVLTTDENRAYSSLRLFDAHGRLVHNVPLGFNRKNTINLPGNISSGVYTVLLEANGLTAFQSKLIVLN